MALATRERAVVVKVVGAVMLLQWWQGTDWGKNWDDMVTA